MLRPNGDIQICLLLPPPSKMMEDYVFASVGMWVDRYIYRYRYIREQLPGGNLSLIAIKLGQSYPCPQGKLRLDFGRSR